MAAHVNDAPGPWMEHLVKTRERLTRPRARGVTKEFEGPPVV
jgi:hypothetical protein